MPRPARAFGPTGSYSRGLARCVTAPRGRKATAAGFLDREDVHALVRQPADDAPEAQVLRITRRRPDRMLRRGVELYSLRKNAFHQGEPWWPGHCSRPRQTGTRHGDISRNFQAGLHDRLRREAVAASGSTSGRLQRSSTEAASGRSARSGRVSADSTIGSSSHVAAVLVNRRRVNFTFASTPAGVLWPEEHGEEVATFLSFSS